MARSGHNEAMKQAKVSELKASLSAYLADVRRGETIIVCDRNTPIARIVPFEGGADDFKIDEATRPWTDVKKIKGVRPSKPVDVDKLLREMRGDR